MNTTRDLPALANDVRTLANRAAQSSPYRMLDGDVQTAVAALDLDTLTTPDVITLARLLQRDTSECRGRTRALASITRIVWAAHESSYSC